MGLIITNNEVTCIAPKSVETKRDIKQRVNQATVLINHNIDKQYIYKLSTDG